MGVYYRRLISYKIWHIDCLVNHGMVTCCYELLTQIILMSSDLNGVFNGKIRLEDIAKVLPIGPIWFSKQFNKYSLLFLLLK